MRRRRRFVEPPRAGVSRLDLRSGRGAATCGTERGVARDPAQSFGRPHETVVAWASAGGDAPPWRTKVTPESRRTMDNPRLREARRSGPSAASACCSNGTPVSAVAAAFTCASTLPCGRSSRLRRRPPPVELTPGLHPVRPAAAHFAGRPRVRSLRHPHAAAALVVRERPAGVARPVAVVAWHLSMSPIVPRPVAAAPSAAAGRPPRQPPHRLRRTPTPTPPCGSKWRCRATCSTA